MISIIIPNYNGIDNLKKNLPNVLEIAVKRKDCEVIVVDDASTDESVSYLTDLKDKFKEKLSLQIITNDKNKGFSSTVNAGVGKSNGESLLLLNTDVIPQDDFIDLLAKDLVENVFGVGALNKVIENGKIEFEGRGIGQWKRGFLVHSGGVMDKKTTLWVSGGAGLFNKQIWNKLGGLDEIYNPFYWEDIDISYRALKAGFSLVFEKNAVVVHEHSKGSIKQKFSAHKIKTIAYRNQFIFVWKNAAFELFLLNILWLPYHLIKALLSLDFAFWNGFLLTILLLPKIILKRIGVKKLYKKSDREVTISV